MASMYVRARSLTFFSHNLSTYILYIHTYILPLQLSIPIQKCIGRPTNSDALNSTVPKIRNQCIANVLASVRLWNFFNSAMQWVKISLFLAENQHIKRKSLHFVKAMNDVLTKMFFQKLK